MIIFDFFAGTGSSTKAFQDAGHTVFTFEKDPFFTVTADKDYIYFPGMPPKKRKNLNKWRNATEDEINNQLNGKGFEIENENFFEEFMKRADPELMKNLNPTILNSL
jgi:site-specific DNA-cytosine methylase